MKNQVGEQIDELVGALTDPIIVMPGGWEDILPDWIKSHFHLASIFQPKVSIGSTKFEANSIDLKLLAKRRQDHQVLVASA
jgi:hypothetical protein